MTSFREMTAADMPQVFDVRLATTENAVTIERLEEKGVTPASLAAAIEASAKGWVCEEDDKIVGFAMGDSKSGEVTVLALLPRCEGRGIGKQLLLMVQDWLFASGHEEIWLVTSPDPVFRAYGFYQALGWRPTGEIIDGDEKFVLRRL